MQTIGAFMASLVVAFVVLSVLADRGVSTQLIATGTVAEVHAGPRASVADRSGRSARLAVGVMAPHLSEDTKTQRGIVITSSY